jgi:DNA-binding MarR family transcriptional regulator
MRKALEPEATALRLWRQLYQTYTLVKQTEDMVFEEHGLTTEQYAVLVSISYLGEPARITDIARWLERSTNSISMIVDRMVKAGLVRRVRDKRDRRVVYVSKTSKAESLFAPATVASFESVRKILSPMPHRDRLVLLDLLADVKYETLKHLRPEVDIEKTKREELRQAANIDQWLSRYAGLSSTPEGKRKGSARGKTRKNIR